MRLKSKISLPGTRLKHKPMNNEKIVDLREKILKGIELSFEKLIKTKQKSHGKFVYVKDDKIIFIKAKELAK
jgi:hypothetical protein